MSTIIGGHLDITEKAWLQQVRDLARTFGWETYHTHNSLRSEKGWPDLVLCKPPRILFVELKRERGKATPMQDKWLKLLRECGLIAEIWRPSDWDRAAHILSGGQAL